MKRPNPFIWIPLGLIVKLLAFFKRQKVIKRTKIHGPAITLSNHTSFYDFIYTNAVLYPKRTTYLAAKKMFYDPVLGFFLRLAGAIPKALLEPDPVATAKALKIIKQGGILSIFPEGQISASGVFLNPSFSIAKLIKKANVPVYSIKHHNAYFVNPPWTKKTFAGRVETAIEPLFTTEQIATYSEQEIFDKLCERLAHNPHTYNQTKKYRYHVGDLAGLDCLLYQCPKCQNESLSVKHRTISCSHCGHQAMLDNYWNLGDSTIDEYYEKQRAFIKAAFESNVNFSLSSDVDLMSFYENKLVKVGTGHLTLSREGYHYVGTVLDKEETLHFNSKLIPSLPSDIGRNIQIYHHGQIYQFEFSSRIMPTKFVLLSEILYEELNRLQ